MTLFLKQDITIFLEYVRYDCCILWDFRYVGLLYLLVTRLYLSVLRCL